MVNLADQYRGKAESQRLFHRSVQDTSEEATCCPGITQEGKPYGIHHFPQEFLPIKNWIDKLPQLWPTCSVEKERERSLLNIAFIHSITQPERKVPKYFEMTSGHASRFDCHMAILSFLRYLCNYYYICYVPRRKKKALTVVNQTNRQTEIFFLGQIAHL